MLRLAPTEYEKVISFDTLEHKLDLLYQTELITKSQKEKKQIKAFKYYDAESSIPLPCEIIGYIPYEKGSQVTLVLDIEGSLHKVMPMYLSEMQKNTFKSKRYDYIDTIG